MKAVFRITSKLVRAVQTNLERPHPFAMERVGWLRCRVGDLPEGGLVILAHDYFAVADGDYVDDRSAGAVMGSAAIRKALQLALNDSVAMVHVHLHDHLGPTGFSQTDSRENAKFIPDFWHVRPEMPHGAVVLSRDSACGRFWYPGGRVLDIDVFEVIGAPLVRIGASHARPSRSAKLSRRR